MQIRLGANRSRRASILIALLALLAPCAAVGQSDGAAAGGFDPIMLIFLAVPGYFVLQATLTSRTSGGWRKASLVPLVLMVPIMAYTLFALAAQSNLWPLLLIFTAPLAFLYLVCLSVVMLLWRLARAV